ncbi:MAG: TatD family hydrolase [Gemmataceae bacterium]
MAPLIDTHAHLDDDRFAADLPAVLDRAAAAGVVRVLTIGVDLATSRAAVGLAARHRVLAAVVGIQPNHAAEAAPTDWDEVADLASRPEVVGVGESGLDRYWDRAPFPLQEDYFVRHLHLARRLGKPIVIHCRRAEADVVRVLRAEFDRYGPVRGVMHSFSGDADTAAACVAVGLHVSFAGMLTYKTAADLRAVAATVPADRLLVETDSPYLAPVPVRGKRNEPAFVRHTVDCLAAVRGVTAEVITDQTTQNARELFRV